MVAEISLHLISVHGIDIDVGDCETASPLSVHLGQLRVGGIENAIEEGEAVGDAFNTFDLEAVGGFSDGGFQVRHLWQCTGFLTSRF